MKKALVLVGFLVILAGALWWGLRYGSETATSDAEHGSVEEAHLVGRARDADRTSPREDADDAGPRPAEIQLLFAVFDRVTGLPVESAFARVPSRDGLTTVPATDGNQLRLDLPAEAVIPIEIGAEGYLGRRIELQPGPATEGGVRRVALVPFAQLGDWRALKGQVVNERGHPVEGALVWTSDMSWWTYEALHVSTRTDAEGRFEIVNPMSGWGGGHVLRAHHPTEGEGMSRVRYPDAGAPLFGRGPTDRPRAVELQRDIRIVLGPARRLPVAIEGAATARAATYTLEIRPAESRFDAALAVARTRPVRHGEEVALGVGTWALLLRASPGGHLMAEPLHVEVDAEGCHRSTPKPQAGWDDASWDRGEALTVLPFAIVHREVRVRVLANGTPVPGARIRIESSRHADPFLVKYSERDAPGGILGSGILADYQPGRRDIDTITRVGRTDADGVATLRGWMPEPALVQVRDAFVVDHFETVESWPVAPAAAELHVVVGGVLDVHLPRWLDRGISLRDLQSDGLIYARKRDLPLALPSGRYLPRVRQWSRDGRISTDRPLAPPVEIRPGATQTLDLRDVAPPLVMSLRLRSLHAHGTVRIRQRGRHPPRDLLFEDGVARWEMVTYGRSQLVIAWAEASGVQHEHRVMLQGIGRADEDTTEVEHDLDYKPGSIDIEIENRGDRAMALALGGNDLDAPYDYGHSARVVVPPGKTTRTTVHDLPPGTYRVYVNDEECTAEREWIEVVAGQTVMFRSTVQRQLLRLTLAPADEARSVEELEGGRISLRGPAEEPRPDGHLRSFGGTIMKRGVCVIEKLPPGTYEAKASWPGDRWHRGMHAGLHYVSLGTIRIERGENERALRVPTREE